MLLIGVGYLVVVGTIGYAPAVALLVVVTALYLGQRLSARLVVLAVGLAASYLPGSARRLPLLIGAVAATLLYGVLANGLGLAESYGLKPLDLARIAEAPWFGWPHFSTPVFEASAIWLIAPVALVLVAENLGHVKAIGAMTGRNLDPYLGRAFLGDGLATMLSGAFGGTGVTTYAENMGVMAVTRIYSTLVFVAAAGFAILLGFSPKFGALVLTIPGPVVGGLALVVFGLIAATGGRIWVQDRTDFSDARNLVTAAVALIAGAGDLTVRLGDFALGGIGTATFGAILVYHLLGSGPAEESRVRRASPSRVQGRALVGEAHPGAPPRTPPKG